MQNQLSAFNNPQYKKVLRFAVYALILVYLLNCLSPLRLHVDTLRYFAIRDCIDFGCDPQSTAGQDYLPYGYTALLLGLSKINLLTSFTIILFNCGFLFGGLYFVNKIFKETVHPVLFLLLVLLNWTTIKFVAHPLSEMQYVLLSMLSLYLFYRFTQTKNFLTLGFAFISGAMAFLTRSVGIALAAALLLSLVWEYRLQLISLIKRNKVLASVILVVIMGVILFSKQLGLNHYTGVFNKQFEEGVGFSDILKWHFREWAEISLNMSEAKVGRFIPSSLGKAPITILGLICFGWFVYLLLFRRKDIPFIIKAYLIIYSVLMFNWPFYDPRFWVPVIPLIVAVILQSPFPVARLSRVFVYLLFAGYTILGLVTTGYFTYTSLNKEVMARTQANGVYRNEYETVFFGKPQTDTAKQIDPVIVDVIKRFNK